MQPRLMTRAVLLGAAAAIGLFAISPSQGQAQSSVSDANAVVRPADAAIAPASPVCSISPQQARFALPLVQIARRLASRQPIKIIALGSSSTYGAGASTSAAAYPSRLAEELTQRFPGQAFTVLNRGVNGEEASDMLARLDAAVLAEKPDLVLWQVGTNSVLRERELPPHISTFHQGLVRLKASGADIVLIDPQYAPRVIAKPNCDAMVALIAATAKAEHVDIFHRHELMRGWYLDQHLPFETFLSADGLHMNDWSYACLAKALGMAIAEAATRPIATATR
jgi:acyl-CoA thioesterase I